MAIAYTGRVFSVDVETIPGPNGREYQVETVPPSAVRRAVDDA